MTTMNKFLEMFRNLKSDAVPRPPRPSKEEAPKTKTQEEENNENLDPSDEAEEILIESDDEVQSEKKPEYKKPGKKEGESMKKDKHSSSTVNTQAVGPVINVINSRNVRWGDDYYMGPAYMTSPPKHYRMSDEADDLEHEEDVKMCNNIKLLLEAKIEPEHEYIDHIAKNLGKNWQRFFLKLGYSKNRIETIQIDTDKYGVSEARYKLLKDWINKEDDPSLGRLVTHLWEYGERQLVKELSLLYKRNKN